MSFFAPVSRTVYGFRAYMKGVGWLRENPRYLFVLSIPCLLGFFVLFGGWIAIAEHNDAIVDFILFSRPEAWYWLPFYWASWILLNLAIYLLMLLAAMLFVNVISSPFYEVVSVAVERDVLCREPEKLDFWETVKVVLVELKKVCIILIVSIILLFIPFVNVVSIMIQAFLVGWEFFDYPLARRGYSLRDRMRRASGDFWAVMGLGVWLLVPFVQILLMPLAVAGGTLLGLEKLEGRKFMNSAGVKPVQQEV